MIAVLGINHKTAHVDVRELFSIPASDIGAFAEQVLQKTDIKEIVVLSTCNRTEIYFYQQHTCHKKDFKQVSDILHDFVHCKTDYFEDFYTHTRKDAIKHLFRVTSGLDSMVLGEDQVINQVKEAYLRCTDLALTDAVLMRLFQKSFEAGKSVRTETNIQKGARSVSYVAVDLCIKKIGAIHEKKILLIGTGETGKIALSHLKKKGGLHFTLANRTFETAEKFAKEYGGTAVTFIDFKKYLEESDIIITATNATHNIITNSDVQEYASKRHHTQLFIDLSVPRNIDESISKIKNTLLFGVDDLQILTEDTMKMRQESVEKAEIIIKEMTDEYVEWFNTLTLRPIITSMAANLEKIHLKELSCSEKCYTPEQFELIKEYSSRLNQKYSRMLIKNLRKIEFHEEDTKILKKILDLFHYGHD